MFSAKFKTRCLKNGELIVIDGEAVALLPTLTLRATQGAVTDLQGPNC